MEPTQAVSVFSYFKNVQVGDKVYFKLLKQPYADIIVDLSGNVGVTDENRLFFDYTLITIPEGYDVSLLNNRAFTDLLGGIVAAIIEREIRINGAPENMAFKIGLEVDEVGTNDGELEPKYVEVDQQTGTTTISY